MTTAETRTVSVESYLMAHANRIACNGCGNCCPISCAQKKDASCAAHPTVLGKEVRMQLCRQSPVYFFLRHGIACEPVLSEIRRVTGSVLETTTHRDPYPYPHRDLPGCVYVDHLDLSRIREARVSAAPLSFFIPLTSIHPRANLLATVTS